jgi:hypothetical protein
MMMASLCQQRGASFMDHDMHLADDVDKGGIASKIVAIALPVAIILAVVGWVVYGSGMM